MLDRPASYDRLPYFFSDQYDVGKEGRVVAGMNVNVWDVTDAIQDLIRSRSESPRRTYGIPTSPSRSLVSDITYLPIEDGPVLSRGSSGARPPIECAPTPTSPVPKDRSIWPT